MKPQGTSAGAGQSPSDTPSTVRLVIRVKIPQEPTTATPAKRPSRAVPLLTAGAAAVLLLSWIGISLFRTDRTSVPAVTAAAPNPKPQSARPIPAPNEAAPIATSEPPRKPATETADAKSAKSEVREQSRGSPSPINEVIPDVPRSALQTIRGTIRVSIRVIVDAEGTVLAATADEPGPSRYFERLAIEASKKWTFTPADSETQQRIMLVRFNFTRAGTTARAKSLQ